MGAVVALGEETLITGWGLAGVRLAPAGNAAQVHRAWAELEPDVALVVLTSAAADALGSSVRAAPARLTVVLPS
jgi:vacuolar-type H+-ATPase subunit F/Vma7